MIDSEKALLKDSTVSSDAAFPVVTMSFSK